MIARRRLPETASINYADAVAEAQQIIKQIDASWMRLGELADRLEPICGEKTLERFAADIGSAVCTLERRRDVYRAWKEIPVPGRGLSYAVARELATHPDRFKIVEANLKITKREAAKIMRQHRKPGTTSPPMPAWERSLLNAARKALELAEPEQWAKLGQGECNFDVDAGLEQVVAQTAQAWAKIAECLQKARHQRDAEHAEEPTALTAVAA